jgi:hypothetical protein
MWLPALEMEDLNDYLGSATPELLLSATFPIHYPSELSLLLSSMHSM